MLKFEASIKSPSGETSLFRIQVEISENGLEGDMLLEGTVRPLLHVHSAPTEHSMYCLLMWMGVYQRTIVVATVDDDGCTLSIRPFGQPFDYSMSQADYQAYLHFLRRLDLDNPFPLSPREHPLSDAEMNDLEVGLKHVSLYLGSNFYKNLPMQFTACSVNDMAVSVAFPHRLPQGLGSFLPLGLFKTGEVIAVAWSFETGDTPTGAKAAVGVFRGDTMRDRTFLQDYILAPRHSYIGQASVTV
jgi:hypothetical protein